MKPESAAEVHKTRFLTLFVIAANVAGNVALSRGMREVGQIVSASPLDYARAFTNPWTLAGVGILTLWMITDLALLSRADLSFVLPVTGTAYILIALAAHFLLHDHISAMRWVGIIVISVGAVLVGETPARTTDGPPEPRP
jgi:drug/metabolite transporter (DMT)-like permease